MPATCMGKLSIPTQDQGSKVHLQTDQPEFSCAHFEDKNRYLMCGVVWPSGTNAWPDLCNPKPLHLMGLHYLCMLFVIDTTTWILGR